MLGSKKQLRRLPPMYTSTYRPPSMMHPSIHSRSHRHSIHTHPTRRHLLPCRRYIGILQRITAPDTPQSTDLLSSFIRPFLYNQYLTSRRVLVYTIVSEKTIVSSNTKTCFISTTGPWKPHGRWHARVLPISAHEEVRRHRLPLFSENCRPLHFTLWSFQSIV